MQNTFKGRLLVRGISGTLLVVILLGLLYAGGMWWHAFSALVALASLLEFYRMHSGVPIADYAIGLVTGAFILFATEVVEQPFMIVILAVCCFAVYFIELARRQLSGSSRSLENVGVIMIGLVYTVIPWYCMIRFRYLPDPIGWAGILSVFLCTWSCDVFAYLFGSKWGTLRVCPHISPNKSLEGFVGGFVASVLCGGLCALYFSFSPLPFILVGVACGSLGQLGDLVESLIKRENGVKDSGNVIPGHGGFLDRFDSILINALCAWCIWWINLI